MIEEPYFELNTRMLWREYDFALRLFNFYQKNSDGSRGWLPSKVELDCLTLISQFNDLKGQRVYLSTAIKLAEISDEVTDENKLTMLQELSLFNYSFGIAQCYENDEIIGHSFQNDIWPDLRKQNEKRYLYKLFPYRLFSIESSKVGEFLEYHLTHNFAGNLNEFVTFLNVQKAKHLGVFGAAGADVIFSWIGQKKQSKELGKGSSVDNLLPLEKLRRHVRETEFERVLEVLKGDEVGGWFDDDGNFVRRYDRKASCGSLIYMLWQKRLLLNSKDSLPSNKEIVRLVHEIFGIKLGIDSAKRLEKRRAFKSLQRAFTKL